MHKASLWPLIVCGFTSMALLIYHGIMEVRRSQRLRKVILRRLK